MEEHGPHRVVALALPAVVAFDLAIAAQIFGHRDERSRYAFTVCASTTGPLPTSTGFAFDVAHGLDALDDADTVVGPGFHPLDPPDGASLAALCAAADRGARIASVCVGAFALAEAGLLDGRTATTHWEYADRFRARFPQVRLNPDVLYVDEGQVLTSAGISAGIDLCLHLVRRDHGEHVAATVARRMVVATHRTGGQTQYAARPMPTDGGLGPTREWAITDMARPLTVQALARHAGLPVRSFARQFHDEVDTSPMRWLTAQRVREAARLLEATSLGVDEVADRCGFGSAATLRVHSSRVLGVSPSTYRRRHRYGGGSPVTTRRRLHGARPARDCDAADNTGCKLRRCGPSATEAQSWCPAHETGPGPAGARRRRRPWTQTLRRAGTSTRPGRRHRDRVAEAQRLAAAVDQCKPPNAGGLSSEARAAWPATCSFHAHLVWRGPRHDFGLDVLARHRSIHHHDSPR